MDPLRIGRFWSNTLKPCKLSDLLFNLKLGIPDRISSTGYARWAGPGDGSKPNSYCMYKQGYIVAGNWRTGCKYSISSKEVREYKEDGNFITLETGNFDVPAYQEPTTDLSKYWKAIAHWSFKDAQSPPKSVPYSRKKKLGDISDLNVRTKGTNLYIPFGRKRTKFAGYEQIWGNGGRKTSKGTTKKGNYHLIEGDNKKAFICEGWADGVILHRLTGRTVFVALCLTNVRNVIKSVKTDYPDINNLIFMADNNEAGTAADRITKSVKEIPIKYPPQGYDDVWDWWDKEKRTSSV